MQNSATQMQSEVVQGFRLSPQQRRLWSLRAADGGAAFRACAALVLGGLSRAALDAALRAVVSRHEILRTTFRQMPGAEFPVQVIGDACDVTASAREFEAAEGASLEATVEALLAEESALPYDPAADAPLRVSLFEISEGRGLLVLSLPALCSDLRGVRILVGELAGAYEAALLHAAPRARDGEEVLQYADISEVFNELLESEEAAGDPRADLEDALRFQLPSETPRAAGSDFRPRSISRAVAPDLAAKLAEYCDAHDVQAAALLQACWQVLLHRLTGRPTVVVGTDFSGRSFEGLDALPGLFARTLPVACRFEDGARFADILAQVARAEAEAEARLNGFSWDGFDADAAPFLPVCFEFSSRAARTDFAGLRVEVLKESAFTERFTLKLNCVSEPAGSLVNEFQFDAQRLRASAVEKIARNFEQTLRSALEDAQARVGLLEVLDEDARREVLEEFNDTREDFGASACVHELFERQAARTPDRAAVLAEGESLTYAELDSRAARLASRLRSQGVGPESFVGLLMNRSAELVVAMLGVLKAGAAYVPLDPEHPQDRIRLMIEDARARVVLTCGATLGMGAACGAEELALVEGGGAAECSESQDAAAVAARPENPAYVIYTSGSTGTPKGVVVTHRSLFNHMLWMKSAFPLAADDRVLQKTPAGFDASVWEFYAPLLSGATLVVARPGGHRDASYLTRLMAEEAVTVVQCVPTLLRMLAEDEGLSRCESLRLVFCGGEALPAEAAAVVARRTGAEVWNLYGPTEATIDASACRFDAFESYAGGYVPVGRPVSNTQIYLLGGGMKPVPAGAPGELYIGGECLARGYLGRPELTAEKFVPNPFSNAPGARLYKTGDLGRYLAGGDIEFLGRADDQVKVRGFRIELGEIEAALSAHESVRSSAVAVRQDAQGEPRLVAYTVAREGCIVDNAELRVSLGRRLPEYMVPSAFVALEELPLTSSGKIDRKRLPEPGRAESCVEYVAPRGPLESALAEVWAEVLGAPRVGVDDNFFALGGDSIRSVRVLALAREKGIDLTLQQLFKHQTIAELVAQAGAQGAAVPQSRTETQPFSLVSEEDRLRLPADLEDAYPLSMLQSGMLYHMEMWPESPAYHNINTWHLRAPLDEALLRDAMQQAVDRHPVLRTSFDLTGYGEPLQLVHRSAPLEVVFTDLRGLKQAEQESAVEAFLLSEKTNLFGLSEAPQMRFNVHRFTDETFQLTLTECHAVSDGWSTTSTLAEIFNTYFAALDGAPAAEGGPLSATFRDFVRMEREALASEESRAYWERKLEGASPLRIEPAGAPRYAGGPRTKKLVCAVRPETVEAVEALAQSLRVPFKSVLLAAHLRVMGLVGGQDDVLTGVLFNGRSEERDGEQVRGLFLNTLPFRFGLTGGTWADLIRAAFEAEQELLPHRRYPLAALQSARGRDALFETMFTFLNFHANKEILDAGRVQAIERGTKDLSETNLALYVAFSMQPGVSQLRLVLDFDLTKFGEEQVKTFQSYYLRTLEAMTADASGRYETHDLLSDEARGRMLVEWNDTAATYPDKCVHELFEQQVARTPDRVAVVCGDERLLYGELNRRANQLARHLRAGGVAPGTLVGVMMERSVEMVVAMLGVLKAGAAYVPLDAAYPTSRLAVMLEDARIPVVLTQRKLAGALPEGSTARVVALDEEWGSVAGLCAGLLGPVATRDDLAYVIFTSGSTGRPKGVQVSHRAFNNLLTSMGRRPGLNGGDTLLSVTTLSFDIAGLEIFLPLVKGARLHIATRDEAVDGAALAARIADSGATFMQATPATWRLLIASGWAGDGRLKVLCGGEALSRDLADQLLERCGALWNVYGPTETTIWSTLCEVKPGDAPVTIGRPVANTRVYILDRLMRPQPAGVHGELYIGGDGLARGYLGRPELTAEKFVPDPFSDSPGARLYRTGDRARYLADGQIEFLGRLDYQVKIRGFRIELGEIESALVAHDAVRAAVVSVRPDEQGESRLVAYFVADGTPGSSALREHLRGRLPEYMVPSVFVALEELPLTPNGKIDRKRLPEPEPQAASDDVPYVAPGTFIEEEIASIWTETLRLGRAGVRDNFFDAGGHSLKAMQLLSHVRAAFSVEIALRDFFLAPTIEALALMVEESLLGAQGGELEKALSLVEGLDDAAAEEMLAAAV